MRTSLRGSDVTGVIVVTSVTGSLSISSDLNVVTGELVVTASVASGESVCTRLGRLRRDEAAGLFEG